LCPAFILFCMDFKLASNFSRLDSIASWQAVVSFRSFYMSAIQAFILAFILSSRIAFVLARMASFSARFHGNGVSTTKRQTDKHFSASRILISGI
jgi:hypothetical protein